MSLVRETILPGLGVRLEFTTDEGIAVAVVIYHDGRRELVTYLADDPDACNSVISLSEHDTQTLAEILGVSQIAETVARVRQGESSTSDRASE